jgi:hypothetical protein
LEATPSSEQGESPTLAPSWHPLAQIDEYLLVKGWTFETGEGWLAPQQHRDAIAMHIGRGHLRRGLAAHMQILWDETFPVFPPRSTAALALVDSPQDEEPIQTTTTSREEG